MLRFEGLRGEAAQEDAAREVAGDESRGQEGVEQAIAELGNTHHHGDMEPVPGVCQRQRAKPRQQMRIRCRGEVDRSPLANGCEVRGQPLVVPAGNHVPQ